MQLPFFILRFTNGAVLDFISTILVTLAYEKVDSIDFISVSIRVMKCYIMGGGGEFSFAFIVDNQCHQFHP